MKTAVIGIGSNSVRMLVSEIQGEEGRRIRREREGTRLFTGLDENRMLQDSAMLHTCEAVEAMAELARRDGAEEFLLFATSATRDAVNREAFGELLRRRTGMDMVICSGEEEAMYSFLGAVEEGYCGVVDIGGGSTEIVTGSPEKLTCAFSCQMGAVRFFREWPLENSGDMERVIRAAEAVLEENLRRHPVERMPDTWCGTGGTFTTLASMNRGVPWTNRQGMHGTELERGEVEEHGKRLADMTVEERKKVPEIQPNRADIIVHGICILLACMRVLGMRKIRVSEYGNLDGYTRSVYHLRKLQ